MVAPADPGGTIRASFDYLFSAFSGNIVFYQKPSLTSDITITLNLTLITVKFMEVAVDSDTFKISFVNVPANSTIPEFSFSLPELTITQMDRIQDETVLSVEYPSSIANRAF